MLLSRSKEMIPNTFVTSVICVVLDEHTLQGGSAAPDKVGLMGFSEGSAAD